MPLILIGLRGSGKSTVGRALAASMSRAFVDLDDRTAAICGMDAATCFATQGESAWRDAEIDALRVAIADPSPSVLALGGGTPMAPSADAMLETAKRERDATIYWLDAPPEVLVEWIGDDPNRPPLTDLDPLAEMVAIDAVRRPVFTRLADHVIEVRDRSTEDVVAAIRASFDG